MLPVYVINLDRRPDRWGTVSAKCGKLGIQVERVPAIDARTIERSGLLTSGEAACAMSHCKALRAFLATDRPAAMVLEDDVEMASDMIALLRGIDWWPPRTNLIKCDNPGEKPRILGRSRGKTPTGRDLHEVMLSAAGAGAYLLNRPAARLAIEQCEDLILPMDVALFDLRRSEAARKLRPLQVVPTMAIHDHEGSDLQAARSRHGPTRHRWPRHLRRTAGSLAQKARVFVFRAVGRARRYEVPFLADCPVSAVDPEQRR